ncbi:MAG: hypothetical protein ABIN01_11565 [Ferruginibacter sp.]
MNIFRLAFELFALYLLYKLIFDFIIPVVRTTKQVKKQFGDMSAQMQEKMNQQQQANFNGSTSQATTSVKNDDYIEFEEVPTNPKGGSYK